MSILWKFRKLALKSQQGQFSKCRLKLDPKNDLFRPFYMGNKFIGGKFVYLHVIIFIDGHIDISPTDFLGNWPFCTFAFLWPFSIQGSYHTKIAI